MESRAQVLIRSLELVPHPEGGHFREVFRSSARVRPDGARSERSALTTIFYLLRHGERSRLHRVASDEVWHFYEGWPLDLVILPDVRAQPILARLGAAGDGRAPVHVVPAGAWQAARSTGEYSLVGCTVGPGFEFADFEVLADESHLQHELRARFPHFAEYL